MQRIKHFLSVCKRELLYIWLNKIVAHIPCWSIRKTFYLLAGMKIGRGTRINAGTIIDSPKNIKIGERCVINENAYLDGRGGLTIGNDVSISIFAKIVTASHYVDSNVFQYYNDSVEIHDNVWIGIGAIVLNGSILNKNAVIGAGCVFKGTAGDNGIYVGNPAKVIRKRELNSVYRLQNLIVFR